MTHVTLQLKLLTAIAALIVLPSSFPELISAQGSLPPSEWFGLVEEDTFSVPPTKVVKECTSIINKKPVSSREVLSAAYNSRMLAYMALRKYAEAKADIEQVLAWQPNDPALKCRHAAVIFALGSRQEALREDQDVIRDFPQFAPARAAFAGKLAVVGREEEAMEQINRAISLDKDNPFFRYTRGLLHHRKERFEDALEDVSFLISKVPFWGFASPTEPYLLRGNCLLLLHRPRAAIPNFLVAKRFDPSNGTATLGLWKAYSDMEKWEVAWSLAEECMRNDPKSTSAKLLYVQSAHKTGRLAEGEKVIRELLADNPNDSSVLSAAGTFYCYAGKAALGVQYFDKALRLDADDISSLYGKALCLASNPDKDIRNGPVAAKLADRILLKRGVTKAVKLQAKMLLATAQAECGDFDKAVSLAKAALKETGPEAGFRRNFEDRLRLFEQRKPYRSQAMPKR